MANDRLTRRNLGYYIALREAVPTFFSNGTFSAAQLNGNLVYDVTCALTEADTSFTLDDSETSDELTFCSYGNEVTPTSQNATAVFTALRDANKAQDTVFNLARDLMSYPDVEYVLIERMFKNSDLDFQAGDIISAIAVSTDLPVDVVSDSSDVKITQNFISSGEVAWNVTIAA